MESAILGFLGVIIGTIISGYTAHSSAQAKLEAEKRKARQDYLILRMNTLSQNLADYEVWLTKNTNLDQSKQDEVEHARIIGLAIATCLAVSDLPEKNDKPDKNITPETLPDIPYRSGSQIHIVHRLAYIANKRLTRNLVTGETTNEGDKEKKEVEIWGKYPSRNRDALDHAVKRLAQLIAEIEAPNTESQQ